MAVAWLHASQQALQRSNPERRAQPPTGLPPAALARAAQAGIVAADKLVTVSQAYATEVLKLPQQQGLELLLAEHKERLVRSSC